MDKERENIDFIEQNYDNIRHYLEQVSLSNFKPGNILSVTKATDSSNNTCYIMLNSNMFPVESTVSTLRTQLIIITMIMLILSFLISIRVSKVISEPIIDLNKNAKRIATGDYSTKLDNKWYSEIVELSNTLNYTTEELHNNFIVADIYELGEENLKTDFVTISYSKPSKTVSIDLKKLEEKEPELYEDLLKDYKKETVRKGSYRYTFK